MHSKSYFLLVLVTTYGKQFKALFHEFAQLCQINGDGNRNAAFGFTSFKKVRHFDLLTYTKKFVISLQQFKSFVALCKLIFLLNKTVQ